MILDPYIIPLLPVQEMWFFLLLGFIIYFIGVYFHEFGHVLALKYQKLPYKWVLFSPLTLDFKIIHAGNRDQTQAVAFWGLISGLAIYVLFLPAWGCLVAFIVYSFSVGQDWRNLTRPPVSD